MPFLKILCADRISISLSHHFDWIQNLRAYNWNPHHYQNSTNDYCPLNMFHGRLFCNCRTQTHFSKLHIWTWLLRAPMNLHRIDSISHRSFQQLSQHLQNWANPFIYRLFSQFYQRLWKDSYWSKHRGYFSFWFP